MRLSLIYLKKKNSVDWFWLLQVRCEFGRAEMSQCYLDKQVLKILLIIQPVSLQRIAGLHHHWSYSEILSHLYYMLNVIRTVEVWPTSPYALGLFWWGRTLVGIQLFSELHSCAVLPRIAAVQKPLSDWLFFTHCSHSTSCLQDWDGGNQSVKFFFFPTCFLRLKSHFFWKMAKVHICQ